MSDDDLFDDELDALLREDERRLAERDERRRQAAASSKRAPKPRSRSKQAKSAKSAKPAKAEATRSSAGSWEAEDQRMKMIMLGGLLGGLILISAFVYLPLGDMARASMAMIGFGKPADGLAAPGTQIDLADFDLDEYYVLTEPPPGLAGSEAGWRGSVTPVSTSQSAPLDLPAAGDFPPVRVIKPESAIGDERAATTFQSSVKIDDLAMPGEAPPSPLAGRSIPLFGEEDRLEYVEPTSRTRGASTFTTAGYWKMPYGRRIALSNDSRLLVASSRFTSDDAYGLDLFAIGEGETSVTSLASLRYEDEALPDWVGLDASGQPLVLQDGRLIGYDLANGELTQRFAVEEIALTPKIRGQARGTVAVADRSRRFVLVSRGSAAAVIDSSNGAIIATLEPAEPTGGDVAWIATNDAGSLVAAGWRGEPTTVVALSIPDGRRAELRITPDPDGSQAFRSWADVSADGRLLLPTTVKSPLMRDDTRRKVVVPVDPFSGTAGDPMGYTGDFAAFRFTKVYEEIGSGGPTREIPPYRIAIRTPGGEYDSAAASALARNLIEKGFRIGDSGGIIRGRAVPGSPNKEYIGKKTLSMPTLDWTWTVINPDGMVKGQFASRTIARFGRSPATQSTTRTSRTARSQTTVYRIPANIGPLELEAAIRVGEGLGVRNVNGVPRIK